MSYVHHQGHHGNEQNLWPVQSEERSDFARCYLEQQIQTDDEVRPATVEDILKTVEELSRIH